MEIARRDLILHYLKVARWDLVFPVEKKKEGIARWDSKLIKGDRQKGSRVSLFGGRQMGPRISCWLKRNRQMGFQVEEDCCKRQVSDQSSFNQISFGSSVLGLSL